MPLYEYVCKKCHKKFAEVLTIKEHETKKLQCPKCKSVDLEHVNLATEDTDETLLAMSDALDTLARESPQKAEIVKLRYFTGLENAEIARALGISLSSVERAWAYARSWLRLEMAGGATDERR